MRPTKKQVADLMYAELKGPFEKLGYKGNKTYCCFKKIFPDWEVEIGVRVEYPEWPTLYFWFNLIYVPVEKIMDEAFPAWAKPRKGKGYSRTLGFYQTDFFKNPKEIEDFIVYADDYPDIVADNFFEFFNDKINPVLEDIKDIDKFDKTINQIPFKKSILFDNDINQAYRGLIVRYLADPSCMDEIYEMYKEVIPKTYREEDKKYAKANLKELNILYEYLKNREIN